jgi:hypothetical protein
MISASPSHHPNRARPGRWGRILLAQAAVVLVGLASVELFARGYLFVRGGPYDAERTRGEVQHLLDLTRSFVPGPPVEQSFAGAPDGHTRPAFHPYLGYEVDWKCSSVDDEYRRLRSQGRGAEFQIFIVGGSVAAIFGQYEESDHPLRDMLSADRRIAGRDITVLIFARGGYKEPQQLNFVVYLLALGFRPDVVIDIDGFNETAIGNMNRSKGWCPIFPSAPQWAHLMTAGSSDHEALDLVAEIRESQAALERWGELVSKWSLERSCLLGKLALRRMYALRRTTVERSEEYTKHLSNLESLALVHGPKGGSSDIEAVRTSLECWKESSRSLADLCRARGIVYVQVLQPTMLDPGSKPLTEQEKQSGGAHVTWMAGVELGYPLMRGLGESLREMGVAFIDATRIFADHPEELYYDCCHFTAPGNALLAKEIGAELLRRLPEAR